MPARDPHWYQDAIIYELHVRAFNDANGDGIGDFRGLIEKLDYLRDLGVTALWLLPFYPSPLGDDGYDIADYTDVHPDYGTLEDFKRFLDEAHARGLRVITELVINHTSVAHPWFQRARQASPGSRWRDFYVWSDTQERYADARIIFQDFEASNWSWDPVAEAYYWHRFYHHQPDLNFENPEVHEAVFAAMEFWLDLGVDGMRLDAVPYLYEAEGTNCENLPPTHAFLKKLRARIDARYEDRMLLAEANQWPEDAAAYFGDGDECHMNFHFPVMPRLFLSLRVESRVPILDILEQTPAIPEGCQWAMFLRNHDELTLEMVTPEERAFMHRVYAPDPRARINLGIRRRLGPLLRDRREIELINALLFSLPGTPVLYYGDEIGMGDNIELEDRDGVRTPMQWNGEHNAGFSSADPEQLFLPVVTDPQFHFAAINVARQHGDPGSLLSWTRRLIAERKRHPVLGRGEITFLEPDNERVLCFLRHDEDETLLCVFNLAGSAQHVSLALEAFAGRVPIELFGHSAFPEIGEAPYTLTLAPRGFFWFALGEPEDSSSQLGSDDDLARWLPQQRWFRSKGRRIAAVTPRDSLQLGAVRIVVLEVRFFEGEAEHYAIPLGSAEGSISDAVEALDGAFLSTLLESFGNAAELRGEAGQLSWRPRPGFALGGDALDARGSGVEQSNSSVFYGDRWVLKWLRVLEPGLHPDVELGDLLTEQSFAHAAPFAGSIEYRGPGFEAGATLATLHRQVSHVADGWTHILERLDAADDARDFIRLLGQRTGELHRVLAGAAPPTTLSLLDQRALYQGARQRLRTAFARLRKAQDALREAARAVAESLLQRHDEVDQRLRAVTAEKLDAVAIRTHGDLHLGQVLYTGDDVVFIDFEGEPARLLIERRFLHPALRDVAGMLRSFDYASVAAMRGRPEGDRPQLERWRNEMSAVFLRAWQAAAGGELIAARGGMLPVLLDFYLLDKCLYELLYELDHRPDWVALPLEGLRRLLDGHRI